MALTLAEVEHIAELARLRLSAEEKILYCAQLSAVLDYAAVLQQVDTAAIPPTATVLSQRNVLREDIAAPSLPREDVLLNAAEATEGYFRVRTILETGQ